MKASTRSSSRSLWLSLVFLCCSVATLRAEQFGLLTYQVVGGATVEITDYPGDAVGAVEIPTEVSGLPVTSIGKEAFTGCRGLTSVTIPSGVTTIGRSAFYSCTGLTSVTIPSGVTTVGPLAFGECFELTSIPIPVSVISIGVGAFSGCMRVENFIVESGNPEFAGIEGVLFNAARTTLIQYPGARAGTYSIPTGVASVGREAFSGCTGLTSISIPTSVTSIDIFAFDRCTGLTSISLPTSITSIGNSAFAGCTGLISVSIPASVTSIAGNAFDACSGLTSVSIPPTVTSIGAESFAQCTALTGITIPASVTFIEGFAFHGTALTHALFLGNAPVMGNGVPGEIVFSTTSPAFAIYYLSGSSGFTSPTWNGYPATMIDEVAFPAGTWLLAHGYGYDTDLNEDTGGDGVSLLMAYALDLDPRQNLRASLPVPVLGANSLNLSFHATSPGITYRAETSTDLQNWTTGGVTQTAPGPDQRSTATVSRDSPNRFLRLKIGN